MTVDAHFALDNPSCAFTVIKKLRSRLARARAELDRLRIAQFSSQQQCDLLRGQLATLQGELDISSMMGVEEESKEEESKDNLESKSDPVVVSLREELTDVRSRLDESITDNRALQALNDKYKKDLFESIDEYSRLFNTNALLRRESTAAQRLVDRFQMENEDYHALVIRMQGRADRSSLDLEILRSAVKAQVGDHFLQERRLAGLERQCMAVEDHLSRWADSWISWESWQLAHERRFRTVRALAGDLLLDSLLLRQELSIFEAAGCHVARFRKTQDPSDPRTLAHGAVTCPTWRHLDPQDRAEILRTLQEFQQALAASTTASAPQPLALDRILQASSDSGIGASLTTSSTLVEYAGSVVSRSGDTLPDVLERATKQIRSDLPSAGVAPVSVASRPLVIPGSSAS